MTHAEIQEDHEPRLWPQLFLPETPLAGVQRPVGDLPPVPDDPEAAKRQVAAILAEEVRSIRDAIRAVGSLPEEAQEAHIAAFVERIDALIDDDLAEPALAIIEADRVFNEFTRVGFQARIQMKAKGGAA
jgi:hypothetical protein